MRADPQVTHAYAQALFALARRRGAFDRLTPQSAQLRRALAENKRLRVFFAAPHVPVEAKRDLIEKLFRPNFDPLLADFLLLLLRKARISCLEDVLLRFEELVEQAQGLFAATVTSAVALSADEQDHLARSLESFTKKRLRITFRVNPALLGGIIFTTGDLHIDDSLRGHLKALRERLAAVRAY